MLIPLHKQAATTPKIRAAIQASTEPAWLVAERYGISEQTVWKWRNRDDVHDRNHTGIGRSTQRTPPRITTDALVLTADDIMDGVLPPNGPVAVNDDDQIYLARLLAEKLALEGYAVSFVTPATIVSPFTQYTLEQTRIQARLIELGVSILCNKTLVGQTADMIQLACAFTGKQEKIDTTSNVLVTERVRQTALHDALKRRGDLRKLELIGDAATPGLIAEAVHSGHLAARNFERNPDDAEAELFRRELVSLEQV